jgi:hypothetical protein
MKNKRWSNIFLILGPQVQILPGTPTPFALQNADAPKRHHSPSRLVRSKRREGARTAISAVKSPADQTP